jgi:putative membrane protein
MHSTIVRYRCSLLSVALMCGCGSEPNRSSNTADDMAMTPAQGVTIPPPAEPPAQTSTSTESAARGSSSAPAAERLTDRQIAMVTDLANTAEIEQGNLAQGKAKSAKVKKFAAMMVKHHSEAKTEQAKLYKELNLTPAASPQGNQLKGDADKIIGALRAADGEAFDVEYMNSQVEAHQKVLDTINNELLPAATGEKLKDSLEDMKDTVESHLKEARSIQDDLVKK